MRNITSKLLVMLIVLCGVAVLSTPAEAQRRSGGRGRAYTKADVDRLIRRVEDRSDEFVRLFDRSLDRSSLDGSNREDRLNERARRLENTLDDLRREFDRKESYIETRPEVARCLNVSEEINQVMRRRRMGGETEQQWNLLRAELNALALVYNLRPLRG